MNHTKNIFTPKVILPIKILQALLGFVFLYFIIAQVQRHDFDFMLSIVLFGMFLFSFWVYIFLPHKIIFSTNIIIDWWIWPKTVVKYGDITDIVVYEFNEYGTIQIFRKNKKIIQIVVSIIENGEELVNIIKELNEKGKINLPKETIDKLNN